MKIMNLADQTKSLGKDMSSGKGMWRINRSKMQSYYTLSIYIHFF